MKALLVSMGLAIGVMLGTAPAPAPAAIVLSFTPSVSHIDVGGSVVIDVNISGLDSEVLSGYDLNFLYNGDVLTRSAHTTFTGNFGLNAAGTNGLPEGNLGYDLVSFETDANLAVNQADSFQLFSFTMSGVADGVTNLGLGSNPDFERNFVGLDFLSLDVVVGSACVSVGTGACQANPVPEPATYSLVLLAIAGAAVPGVLRRRGWRRLWSAPNEH